MTRKEHLYLSRNGISHMQQCSSVQGCTNHNVVKQQQKLCPLHNQEHEDQAKRNQTRQKKSEGNSQFWIFSFGILS